MAKIWSYGIFLGMITLGYCIPVDVVYRGEGCDCPTKLDYEVNVPRVPKLKKYIPDEYGYKIDVPAPPKPRSKLLYSFDFIVEEPKIPKPVKESKWNLFAKVDRIAMDKSDCEQKDTSSHSGHYAGCRCNQCSYPPSMPLPSYGYVFNHMPPCACKQSECKCNTKQSPLSSPSNVMMGVVSVVNEADLMPFVPSSDVGGSDNNIRRKRDLKQALLRLRNRKEERPGRFVKMYNKNLEDSKDRLFDLKSLADPILKSKRKTKKAYMADLLPRIVKRDIKGEYDLLEKERDQMDLTLPEIIQFMPETLQPDFKRGQCLFGNILCQRRRNEHFPLQHQDDKSATLNTSPDLSALHSIKEPTGDADENHSKHDKAAENSKIKNEQLASPNKSSISPIFSKRNVRAYNQPILPKPAISAQAINAATQLFHPKSAYYTKSPLHNPTKPIWKTTPSASFRENAYTARRSAAPVQYWHEFLGHKFSEQDGDLQLVSTIGRVPDPIGSDSTPLQYAGDLEMPHIDLRALNGEGPLVDAQPNYPVQHVSNAELDRIIANIMHRHPEFVDATTHYGGGLVDPDPLQEKQTKDFLKKLIDGRLRIWFSDDADHGHLYPLQYNTEIVYPSKSPPAYFYRHTPSS